MTVAISRFANLVSSLTLASVCVFSLAACDNAQSRTVDKSHDNIKSNARTTDMLTPQQSTQNDAKLQQILAGNLVKSGITVKILSVSPTTVPNMYWVKAEGMPPFFTDSTGQYILQGDVIKVGGSKPEHVSANLLAKDAKTALSTIDRKDMIIFPAKGATKGAVYVFTDADCGYCRKFHSEIDQVNGLGIEVRYLPWPRSEQTFPIMEKIWCSSDRNTALTQAKMGMPINAPNCQNPVRKLHDLGMSLGINGTPAIFSEDGQQLGGYIPPASLAEALNIK